MCKQAYPAKKVNVINEIIIDECAEVRLPVHEVEVPDDLNCEDGDYWYSKRH